MSSYAFIRNWFSARRYALLPLALVLAAVAFTQPGCNPDGWRDRPPPDVIYEPDPNAGPGTGSMQVYLFGTGSNRYKPEPGVSVALYASLVDYDKNIALRRGYTDRNGWVDFGPLNFGNYYLHAFKRINDSDIGTLESAQVQDGKRLTRNIILY